MKKKEFSPELDLLLFEEPEAFLNPFQQEALNASLRLLSKESDQQVVISTHSPMFVSKNIEDISALIRLRKDKGITRVFQIPEDTRNRIFQQDKELVQFLQHKLSDQTISEETKDEIRENLCKLEDSTRMEAKAICYSLWLDSERCSAFFANIVLICEGATEKTFINYLIKNEWKDLREKKGYVLDAMGKYNIHKYMNLFKELGIFHSVLADKHKDKGYQKIINEFIEQQRNEFTKAIDFFDNDIEDFLGIGHPQGRNAWEKPINVILHYIDGHIGKEKINELKKKIIKLVGEPN